MSAQAKDVKKVIALMSGGVDSSVAAALLCQNSEYAVQGVYLKLWQTADDSLPPQAGTPPTALGDECWAQEMRDAARVAAHLRIPFEVWDVTEDYKKRVLENFYSEYTSGRTPNPDVLCNSEIKFGVALDRALAMGYEYVATGHYARIEMNQELRIKNHGSDSRKSTINSVIHNSLFIIQVAVDANKDQSYFLWRLTQEQLAHTMFPIGDYTKPQVRQMAKKFGLHNAEKRDSQGVCFLGKIKLKEFLYSGPLLTCLRRQASPPRREEANQFPLLGEEGLGVVRQSGQIVDVHGNLLGLHDGLAHFTVGQRHGVNIGDGHGPYFVVKKDLASNTLIVANVKDEPKYRAAACTVRNVQFHDSYLMTHNSFTCMARTRYRAPLCEVRIMNQESRVGNNSIIHNSCFIIHFKEPQRAVAPGQSIVFYDGDRVIGGGVIDKVTLQSVPQISNIQYPISNKIFNAQILQS